MSRRLRIALLLGIGALLLAGCLFMGAFGVGLPDFRSTTGRVIFFMRVNRVIAGFCVGAALSVAGVVFQALLRNPLAEPYILGVSSGAGLGAAFAILTGLSTVSAIILPGSAFVMAAATLAIVYVLASHRGTTSVYGLILSGVIVSAMASSLLMVLVALAPVEGLHSVIWWMLGSLDPVSARLLSICAIVIAVAILALWALSPELNALTLGRETAHNIGVRTNVAIFSGLALSTLLAATAVGLSGLIGFVGLIVPHMVRNLVGPDHRFLIPISAVTGGVFLAVCDAVARTVLAPIEIPVGVVTAVCGGPFFLFILRRGRHRAWVE